jgi:hypothetical protein
LTAGLFGSISVNWRLRIGTRLRSTYAPRLPRIGCHTRRDHHHDLVHVQPRTRAIGDDGAGPNGLHRQRQISRPRLGSQGDEGDTSVWLFKKEDAATDGSCYWIQLGGNEQFILFNVGTWRVMAYEGGNGGPLVMQEIRTPAPNSQAFSWGGTERWGARALQPFIDSGQNVDTRGDNGPQTGPLHTRGWRDGDQMELTWNAVPIASVVDVS